MVTEVKLNNDQKKNLERQVADLFEREGVQTTGMEVNWVHQFTDGEYRVHYVYEDNKNRDRTGDLYCRFWMNDTTVADLVESK